VGENTKELRIAVRDLKRVSPQVVSWMVICALKTTRGQRKNHLKGLERRILYLTQDWK
jgi:hypothetical protein